MNSEKLFTRVRLAALSFSLAVLAANSLLAAEISGRVRTISGAPLAGAVVSAQPSGLSVVTDEQGSFSLDLPPTTVQLNVSKPGFLSVSRSLDLSAGSSLDLVMLELPQMSESIVVSAIRAADSTPVTKRDLGRREIQQKNYGQEIPFLLAETPSIVTYADSGAGTGYAYFTLRGINQTRVNLTLDGVPLNDLEDMNAYFADYGDFTGFLDSIQIQRGIGTSTVGAPAFGGSVNFASVDLPPDSRTEVELGRGSFGTSQASLSWSSGAMAESGFSLYGRLSAKQSEGYRDHSGVRQRTLFLGATRQSESSLFKLTAFSGKEHSQLAFFATDEATLETNRRFNGLDDQEKDRFQQDFVQLQMTRAAGPAATIVVSGYFNRGYGTYDLFDDSVAKNELRTFGLDGALVGTSLSWNRAAGSFTSNLGASFNAFHRDHSKSVEGVRSYLNTGFKNESNAFAKLGYDRGPWHLYSDLQLRRASFRYQGDVEVPSIDWTFFNPKVGVRYRMSPSNSLYASVGTSTREPARNDLFAGEDNLSTARDLRAVRPEKVTDGEVGLDVRLPRLTMQANLYAMEFRDEIAATGELSELGLLLRRNTGRSYRRGLELDLTWAVTPRFSIHHASNFSRNRIRSWQQFYDVFDASGALVETTSLLHRNVAPLLTPEAIVNQGFTFQASPSRSVDLTGRYVSRSYLDNTANERFATPSYFVLDGSATFGLENWLGKRAPQLKIRANNLLNQRRLYPSGYSYLFLSQDAGGRRHVEGTSYFYPLATRSIFLTLDFRL